MLTLVQLRDTLEAKTKKGPVEVSLPQLTNIHPLKSSQIDLLTWMTRTALELIGQSGLGYSFDPLTETGEQHPYSISVKLLMSVTNCYHIGARRYSDSYTVRLWIRYHSPV